MRVKPPPPRHQVVKLDNGIGIALPTKKNVIQSFFLFFFLLFWGIFVVMLGYGSVSAMFAERGFLIGLVLFLFNLPLAGLGLYYFYLVIWNLLGVEEVLIADGEFRITRRILSWKRSKIYDAEMVHDLRTNFSGDYSFLWYPPYFLRGFGRVAFDYGAKTYHLFDAIDEAEAKQIVGLLQKHLPISNRPETED